MKQIYHFLLAICLMLSSATLAQQNPHEKNSALLKVRERPVPASIQLKREAFHQTHLKNGNSLVHPTSSLYYQWSASDWVLQYETTYDTQGREIEKLFVGGFNRIVTDYNESESLKTQLHQTRNNDQSPWETTMKVITSFDDYSNYEVWELSNGELKISHGWKYIETETIDGNTKTNLWEQWAYNPGTETYIKTSGYKNVLTTNNDGKLLTNKGYSWTNDDWELEYEDIFTYENGKLIEMKYCSYDEPECERIEFIYGAGDEPQSALVYIDEGAGFVLEGRYIQLVWKDWSNVTFTEEGEILLFAIKQVVIDPDGDINDDDNYENEEKIETDLLGNYTSWIWLNNDWVETDKRTSETINGDVKVTSIYFEYEAGYDEDCDVFFNGEKDIHITGTNQTTRMSYVWEKMAEPCTYDWVLEYESIETKTSNSTQLVTRNFSDDEDSEYITYNEWDQYNKPVIFRESGYIDGIRQYYHESSYENIYDGDKLLQVTKSYRDAPDGAYVFSEKIVYAFGGSTSVPDIQQVRNLVYPTVFGNGFNVVLAEACKLVLINTQGQIVWQKETESGSLFVPGNNLPKGMYVIQITNKSGHSETVKLIKK
ncbi:T9SS type A sorting domain-containing protein [Alkaliflexus imshenetskii]|uniref:T9SS type A sorting domain-containing protein n=1 Tax=Alkaliflexus imshenetskii TaxID=286730 RepID=UPI00047AAE8B|nr:T9SS type A sorting domain-containing protein [Alkaliflexus imshenetskii]